MPVSIAACGSDTGTSSGTATTTPRPPLAVSFRWTNPVEKLASPDATFVRAFIESWQAVLYSGSWKDEYPGFTAANQGAVGIGQKDTPSTYKSVSFNLEGIDNQGTETTKAVVCLWPGAEEEHGFPTVLTYFHKGVVAPPADQVGTAKRPNVNVFGDWIATRMEQRSGPDPEWVACDQRRPADLPSMYADLPPVPGWPVAK
ncbi:hypothetical protein GPX89_03775 [Nocardia sp. ET3-3]|uniref:Uncharacterized protein n=1 Tax=Nocardia terrae TaxID=2675851 RepID=A0A7K1UPV5_9NOCA|nr:hypothetical protein [Nocardia terrae]MVU76361.1 hypothetical protein [Nocardia terrae]